jgi:hypothetical protein
MSKLWTCPTIGKDFELLPIELGEYQMPFQHLFTLLFAFGQNVATFGLGVHVWFAQNNSKGGRFHMPANSSMYKMYHPP